MIHLKIKETTSALGKFRRFSQLLLAGVVAIALALAAPQALAKKKKKKEVETCQGQNILREFQRTDRKVYDDIISQSTTTKNDGALLWRIENANGAPPSYLFGTVHLTDKRVTELSKRTIEAIKSARVIALEVADISPQATAAAIRDVADRVIFTDGRRLDQLLTPENFTKVEAVIKRSGMPPNMAPLVKPWIVSMMMAVSECERRSINSGKPVVDIKVAQTARKSEIPVVGLETMESQLTALASIPMEQQIAMLKASLAYADRANDMMETILGLYMSRRMGSAMPLQLALAAKVGIGADAFDAFRQKIIVDRNRQMRTKMLTLLAKGGAFVAVGALHLPGPDGLVSLLRTAGYNLQPLE